MKHLLRISSVVLMVAGAWPLMAQEAQPAPDPVTQEAQAASAAQEPQAVPAAQEAQAPAEAAPEKSDTVVVTKKDKKSVDGEYRRSSLCLMLLDENIDMKDIIQKAFLEAPMPDKYNDHNVSARVIKSTSKVTDSDRKAFRAAVASSDGASAPKKGGGFGAFMGAMAGTSSGSSVVADDNDREYYAAVAHKHLLEKNIAKELFDKWFFDSLGNFTMDLVRERGLYGASLMDVQTAKSSVRGMGMLEDAGEELIGNTFVVVSRFRYMSKEELVKEINAATQAVSNQIGGSVGAYMSMAASLGSMGSQVALGSGYYVRSTSFLFKLHWNKDVAAKLYEMWDNKDAYQASDIFTLKYVGMESAFSGVKAGIFTNKSNQELIRIATVNSTDAVLAKLQKKYDVFKTKTPLLSVDPLTAAIGMKEGVAPGDKYEVLEKSENPETGKTAYKRIGVIKACKDGVCDNRYMAAEELALKGVQQGATVTTFEGKVPGLYPGVLIRQIK